MSTTDDTIKERKILISFISSYKFYISHKLNSIELKIYLKILKKILVQVIRRTSLLKMMMTNKTMTVGYRMMRRKRRKRRFSRRKINQPRRQVSKPRVPKRPTAVAAKAHPRIS